MQKLCFSSEEFPGVLITFCGLDGSGKTTQIDLLCDYLLAKGIDVVKTFQPSSVVRKSELFRRFVDTDQHIGHEYRSLSLMTISDRLQHSRHDILDNLMEGKIVISDRYFYSALVNLRARGYKSDKWIYEIAQLIPKPDAAFFLNLATDDAIQRVRLRASEKDRWIDLEFEHSLNEEFIYIQSITDCISLDSGKGVHQNHFDVVRRVNKVLAEKQP